MNVLEIVSQAGATMAVAPYVLLYLIPAAISAELTFYGWQRRHIRAALPFSLLMAAVVVWSVCHALSVASSTFQETLFWAQLQYGGIVLIGPIWLMFVLAYAGYWQRVRPIHRFGLILPAALSYAAVLTNDSHQLWWSNVTLDPSRPFGSLSITRGLLFWLHFGYSYGCVLLGCALLMRIMFQVPAPQRHQAQVMAVGALFPIAGNLAHILGMRTTAVDDPTPFLFSASGLIIFYAALRYRFLDLAPIGQHELLASMPDGLVVLDHAGVVTAHNDPALRLLQAQANEWVGNTFLGAIAGSPLEIDLRAMLVAPAAPATSNIVYESEAGLRAVELRLRPVYADHSRFGSLLVVRDRTERAQMEQALEQRIGELSTINQLARVANTALQTDDLVRAITRELVSVLPGDRVVIGLLQPGGAALRLVIVEPSDAAPALEGQALDGDELALLQAVLRAGQTHVVKVSDPLLEGTRARAILQREGLQTVLVVPLYSQAAALGAMFVGHADDRAIAPDEMRLFQIVGELVTEAIVRTRLYEQSQEASRIKSTFLAMASHELRTPLTSIIGFTDLLDRGIYGELPEPAHEPLAQIRRGSYTVLRLINDFLDFSKMEAGRFTIELAPVDLSTVIWSVASALRPQIRERGLELNIELASEASLVYANRERLEQVLTNLIANAIKFTEQGSITVRTTYDGERARFSVTDTGIGIAPEHQHLVFQEFRQITNEQQPHYPGTGLGLAISRRLMKMMGGSLAVESTPGVGSTFYGDLPTVPADLQEKEQGSDRK